MGVSEPPENCGREPGLDNIGNGIALSVQLLVQHPDGVSHDGCAGRYSGLRTVSRDHELEVHAAILLSTGVTGPAAVAFEERFCMTDELLWIELGHQQFGRSPVHTRGVISPSIAGSITDAEEGRPGCVGIGVISDLVAPGRPGVEHLHQVGLMYRGFAEGRPPSLAVRVHSSEPCRLDSVVREASQVEQLLHPFAVAQELNT